MNKTWKKKMLLSLALCCLTAPASAEINHSQEFSLEQINVTALRYASNDLNTPADTKVYTQEQLKSTGAANVVDALKFTEGIIHHSIGPHGQSWMTSTNNLTLRGVENGTLVLVNGIPINLNSINYMDQISLDQVEKVEVVKGTGSVLYGSEAFGGIINIITKKTVDSNLTLSGGNNGQQDYNLSFQAGKSGFSINHSTYGKTQALTEEPASQSIGVSGKEYYLTAFGDSKKDSLLWTYKINDKFNVNYMYSNKDYSILYEKYNAGDLLKKFSYDDTKNFVQLEYTDKEWTSKLFLNDQNIKCNDFETARPEKPEWQQTKNQVYGIDTQRTWNIPAAKLLTGMTLQHESYEDISRKLTGSGAGRNLGSVNNVGPYSRNHFAVYGQWDKQVNDKTRLILNAREDILKGEEDNDFHAFSPQLQTLTKIDDNSSWYINIGKSFKMPTFRQLHYSSSMITPNPDLKPETGCNYEVGYKLQQGTRSWKAAVFKTVINDQIISKKLPDSSSQAQNATSFNNTGIEISTDKRLSDKFSYSFGASYGNPKRQDTPTSDWKRVLGRLQLSGSLNYKNGPTTAALNAVYFTDRVNKTQHDQPSMLPVSLYVSQTLDTDRTLSLTVENLLNRHDIISNNTGSSDYYSMPRTYRLGLSVRF